MRVYVNAFTKLHESFKGHKVHNLVTCKSTAQVCTFRVVHGSTKLRTHRKLEPYTFGRVRIEEYDKEVGSRKFQPSRRDAGSLRHST